LEEAASDRIDSQFRGDKKGRVAILCALATWSLEQASKEHNEGRRSDLLDKATHYFNRADKIDIGDEKTWVGKGLLLLRKRDLDRAARHFATAIETNKDSVPGRLGRVSDREIFVPVLCRCTA